MGEVFWAGQILKTNSHVRFVQQIRFRIAWIDWLEHVESFQILERFEFFSITEPCRLFLWSLCIAEVAEMVGLDCIWNFEHDWGKL
jgi:hypothetical protein